MKRLKQILLVSSVAMIIAGCSSLTSSKTAFQTLQTAETAVLAANAAFLDRVVTGQVATNTVPTVEAAFNDTQLAIHTAAASASGGLNAPIPLATNAKVMSFTNMVNFVK